MSVLKPEISRIEHDWQVLCDDIGIRLAGSEGEARAARYILDELEKSGCLNCREESFPCRSRKGAEVKVEANLSGGWKIVESAAVTGSGSTEGTVEGDVVWLEMPEHTCLLKPGSLKGKVAIFFGPLPEEVDAHIRLVEAAPLAVVHVDHRLPFNWVKNDGTYPLWVRKYGFPPTVTVPFPEAWNWRIKGKVRLRINLRMEMVSGESQNVVGEIQGSDPSAGIILVGSHHDSQAGNVGADDNASGVVALLELARLLSLENLRRTVRFVSFGDEEQLSVGSAEYVIRHREELENIVLMINFDSIASPLGHHQLFCSGGDDLADYAVDLLGNAGLHVQLKREVVPFADHFPFSVYQVPALWFFRENFPGGRWQHHSIHDNLENVSAEVLADVVAASHALITNTAKAEEPAFGRDFAPGLRERTVLLARTLFEFP